MSCQDDELDFQLRHYRMLSPVERQELTRRVIARAHAYRSKTIRDLFRRLFRWIKQRAAIAQLQALDDRSLKDIGLYRGDIEAAVRGLHQPAPMRKAA